MKRLALFLLPLLSWFPTVLPLLRADDDVPATRLHRLFPYDKLPEGQSTHSAEVQAGDLIRISIPIPATVRVGQYESRFGLKVEIEGKYVEEMAAVYVPVEERHNPDSGKDVPVHHIADQSQADLSCFLKAVKKGKATVKITLLSLGRSVRDKPSQTVIINVLSDPPEEQTIPSARMHRVYPYDKLRDGVESHTVRARPDDLIQLHVPSAIVAKDKIRSIRVEIYGEAVIKFAVVVPIDKERKDDPMHPFEDEFSKDGSSCLLKAVKPGKAMVKITPIDKDGKEKAIGTVVVTVLEEKPQTKK